MKDEEINRIVEACLADLKKEMNEVVEKRNGKGNYTRFYISGSKIYRFKTHLTKLLKTGFHEGRK